MKDNNERLHEWQNKYELAKASYSGVLSAMDRRERYYLGTRTVLNSAGNKTKRESSNVRNIVFELIETEVDTTIPMPRVEPLHAEDAELAKSLEAFLRSEAMRLDLKGLNDRQERATPIHGADFALVEWDTHAGTHCSIGDVAVQECVPKRVIPQPGVYDLNDMDYFFVASTRTRAQVARQYHVPIEKLSEDEPQYRESADESRHTTSDDLVQQIDCYYKDKDGKIGKLSWACAIVLADEPDYQARKLERCVKCNHVRQDGEKECPVCHGRKFEKEPEEGFPIEKEIIVMGPDGNDIPVPPEYPDGYEYAKNPDGTDQILTDDAQNPILDDAGNTQPVVLKEKMEKTYLPYYKPNVFPLLMRQNISLNGSFLGLSDVDMIADQQEAIKKFGAKIDEKILKGGSIVTMPKDLSIKTSDTELKIVYVDNEAQVSQIHVINVQPNIDKEQTQLEINYSWAKSTLGVTDSFQGKADSSATSGTAKQFAANQSAGRLLSKRMMKYKFYAQLYEYIFKWMLAYADDPIPYSTVDENGNQLFAHFDPKAFLKVDAAGEIYWDDEFRFTVDESATVMSNRETLWNMADVKYQAGAFGPIGDLNTDITLWTWLEQTGYPMAGSVKKNIENRLSQQVQQTQAQTSQAPPDNVDGRTSVQQSDLTNLQELGVM